jgi:hypothetical protein
LADAENLDAQKALVLAAPKGSYGDCYIDKTDASTFVCRVQHIDDGVNPKYAKVISNFYLSKLLGNDTDFMNLTSAAVLEFISGSLAAFSGGLNTSGDFEAIPHFMGPCVCPFYRNLYAQALISDAAPSAIDSSFFGVGLIDTAAKGTNRFMAGSALYAASNFWKVARYLAAVTRLTTSAYDIWALSSMPTSPSKMTIGLQTNIQNTDIVAGLNASVRVHGAEAEAGGTRSLNSDALAITATMTAFGFGVFTGASTTIDAVWEVLSPNPLSIPAGGF